MDSKEKLEFVLMRLDYLKTRINARMKDAQGNRSVGNIACIYKELLGHTLECINNIEIKTKEKKDDGRKPSLYRGGSAHRERGDRVTEDKSDATRNQDERSTQLDEADS